MSNPPPPQVVCTPQQLREVEQYLRSVEEQLHRARLETERVRNARTLRLVRALRGMLRRPLAGLRETWRVLSGPASKPSRAAKPSHRHFAVFRSPAFAPTVATGPGWFGVPAEIADHCARRPVVTLHGIGPAPQPRWQARACSELTPADFELRLHALLRPVLLIDANAIRADSAWAGVFEVDDMRLNQTLAALLELVRARRGRVVFAAVAPERQPPLFADFVRGATVLPTLDGFDPDADTDTEADE